MESAPWTDRTLLNMPPVRRGLGILGGTFDPPHIGHLAAAIEVRSALDLEMVLLMVANEPWQKVGRREISSPQDRLALTRAAVAEHEGIEASDLEIQRGGTTFTFDTLTALRDADADRDLFLIVGADAATGLDTWHNHEALPQLATLVIVDRDGNSQAEPPEGWSVIRVSMPRLDITSSAIRERAARGGPVAPYLDASVIDEARRRGLYGFHDS